MSRVCTKLLILLAVGVFFYFSFIQLVDHMAKERIDQKKTYTTTNASRIPPKVISSGTEEPYIEGKHYRGLSAEVTTQKIVQDFIAQNPGKIQVIEFFNYGCFWCSKLHPLLMEWVKKHNEHLVIYHVPVVFNKQWEVLAKTFYINQSQDKPEQDEVFFKAIHQDHINLSDEKQVKDFFIKNGMNGAKFDEWYHSFTVNRQLTYANSLSNAYQVTVSPAIILNMPSGSYFVSPQMTNGIQGVFEVLNFLVARELKPQ